MKNVLMLLDNEFPPDDRVEKEARSLIDNDFRITILCPTFNNLSQYDNHKGITVVRFPINRKWYKILLGLIQVLPLYPFLWKRQVTKCFQQKRYDIVHIHDLPLCSLAKWLKKSCSVSVVADMHENYPAMVSGQEHLKKFPNRYLISIKTWYQLEKRWLKFADLIICTASGMIERLNTNVVSNKTFALVQNTINIEEFETSQIENKEIKDKHRDQFVLLYYGGVNEQRGIQYVIDAIDIVKSKITNLKLVIVGSGSYMDQLKHQAESLDLRYLISFEGWQNQSFLNSYMENTDVCIIPHIKSEHTDNTSPNKLFHFMYFGKPIIASNCKYIQDIVEKEHCGIIYPYDNAKLLADAILELYNDSAKRRKLGENGKEAIAKIYNWRSTSKAMIEEYLQLKN